MNSPDDNASLILKLDIKRLEGENIFLLAELQKAIGRKPARKLIWDYRKGKI